MTDQVEMADLATRQAEQRTPRTWAKGQLIVTANGVECFNWIGTQGDAVALQKSYLDQLNAAAPIPAKEYADQAVYSMIMHGGPPQIGEKDLTADDVELIRDAVLWLALREHIPDTGLKIEDALANLVLEARFTGDRDKIGRAKRGEEVDFLEFELLVVPRDDYRLNPSEAVSISGRELFAIVDLEQSVLGDPPPFYVPRVPLDADEGREMMQMMTTCAVANPTGPEDATRFYLGYTTDELSRDGLGLRIRETGQLIKTSRRNEPMNTLIPDLGKSLSADEHEKARLEEHRLLHEMEKACAGWHHDELGDDLADIIMWMLQGGVGRGATLLINDLAAVTDEPLQEAIDLLFKAASYVLVQSPEVNLQKAAAVLIRVWGADRVHAAVTAQSELAKALKPEVPSEAE